MKLRIAVLALAVAFLAAPQVCVAELAACSQCCPGAGDAADTDPCGDHDAASDVDTCCETAPVAPNFDPTRTPDAPSPQPLAATDFGVLSPQLPRRIQTFHGTAELAFRTSPLRLSVVRLN